MTWTAQRLLAAVAQAAPDDCITEARMAALTGLTTGQIEDACLRLRKHGFMFREDRDCYRLTVAGHEAHAAGQRLTSGPRGPETGHRLRYPGLRQRAWNALRLGRKVSIDDILLLAVVGSERDPASNVGKYLRALSRAGYLRRLALRDAPDSPTSNGAIRWLLIRDTGPQAPVWRVSRNTLWDPNQEAEIILDADIARVRARRAAGQEARP